MQSLKAVLIYIKDKARKLKHETLVLFWAYRHPATPWYAKVFGALVVGYAFSPIDLIPDFIPILGYLDDLILVPLGIFLALKMIPEEAIASGRLKAVTDEGLDKPKSWWVCVIILLIWLVLAGLGIFWIVKGVRVSLAN